VESEEQAAGRRRVWLLGFDRKGAAAIGGALAREAGVRRVSLESARASLAKEPPDAILAGDLEPADLTELRRRARGTALVWLPRRLDAQAAFEALRCGVDECASRIRLSGAAARRLLHRALARRRAWRERAALERELEHFAAAVCHDLDEPLRTVGRLVREGSESVHDALARTHELLRALQSYARAGARELDRHPVDCGRALDQAAANLESAVRESRARVTRGELPVVDADGPLLVQVFQNLLANAIKFAGQGEPRVHVSATRANGAWIVSVRDEGVGLDPRHAREAFEIFRRLHPGVPGSGVGLAICERVIERHGGRIWVESRPGAGAVFSFSLPA
jgi:signal transduction histidine kinase